MTEQVEITYLGDMQRMELNPGDVIVLRLRGHLRHEELERIRMIIEAKFSGHCCLVLEEGMEIGLIGQSE